MENLHSPNSLSNGYMTADENISTNPTSAPPDAKGSITPPALDWASNIQEKIALQRLEAEHGLLFRKDETNQIYFGLETAAKFILELLNLEYSAKADIFFVHNEDRPVPIPKSKLVDFIATWLKNQGAQAGFTVRPDAPECPLPAIIDRLKELCVLDYIDEAEGLQMFMCERLQRKDGLSLTSEELFNDYREFCRARGAVSYSQQIFLQRIAVALREQFGICRSHSVRRSNPNGGLSFRAGYWGLAFAG